MQWHEGGKHTEGQSCPVRFALQCRSTFVGKQFNALIIRAKAGIFRALLQEYRCAMPLNHVTYPVWTHWPPSDGRPRMW